MKKVVLLLVATAALCGCGTETKTENAPPKEQKTVMVPSQKDPNGQAPGAPLAPTGKSAAPKVDAKEPGDR